MAAYRRVYDSRHLQADCKEPGSAPEMRKLGNRVRATLTFACCNRAYETDDDDDDDSLQPGSI